jgi:hypothetical protein
MRKQLTRVFKWRRVVTQPTRPPHHSREDGGKSLCEHSASNPVGGESAISRAMEAPPGLGAEPSAPPIGFGARVEQGPCA